MYKLRIKNIIIANPEYLNCSQDCHGGGGHAAPMKDQQQNYELLTGFQNDTHTVIRFSRAWDTCDSQDDLVLTVRKL